MPITSQVDHLTGGFITPAVHGVPGSGGNPAAAHNTHTWEHAVVTPVGVPPSQEVDHKPEAVLPVEQPKIIHELSKIAPDRTLVGKTEFALSQQSNETLALVVKRHYDAIHKSLADGTLTQAQLGTDALSQHFYTDFQQRVKNRLITAGIDPAVANAKQFDAAAAEEAVLFVTETHNLETSVAFLEQALISNERSTNASIYGPGDIDPNTGRKLYENVSRSVYEPQTRTASAGTTAGTPVAREHGFWANALRKLTGDSPIGFTATTGILGAFNRWRFDDLQIVRPFFDRHMTPQARQELHERILKSQVAHRRYEQIDYNVTFSSPDVDVSMLTPLEQAIAREYGITAVTPPLTGNDQKAYAAIIGDLVDTRVDYYRNIGLEPADIILDIGDLGRTSVQRAVTHAEERAAAGLAVGATMDDFLEAKRQEVLTRVQEHTTRQLAEDSRRERDTRIRATVDTQLTQLESRIETTADEAERKRLETELEKLQKEKVQAAKKSALEKERDAAQEQIDELEAQIANPTLIKSYDTALSNADTARINIRKHKADLAFYTPALHQITNIRTNAATAIQGLRSAKDVLSAVNAILADRDAQIVAITARFQDKDIEVKGGRLEQLIQQCQNDIDTVSQMEADQPLLRQRKDHERVHVQKDALLASSTYKSVRLEKEVDDAIARHEKAIASLGKPDQYQQRQREALVTYRDTLLDVGKHEGIQHRLEKAETGNLPMDYSVPVYDRYPKSYLRTMQLIFGEDVILGNRQLFEKASRILPPDTLSVILGKDLSTLREQDITRDRINDVLDALRIEVELGELGHVSATKQAEYSRIAHIKPDASTPALQGAATLALDSGLYHYDGVVDLANQIMNSWSTTTPVGLPVGVTMAMPYNKRAKLAQKYAAEIHARRQRVISQTIGLAT